MPFWTWLATALIPLILIFTCTAILTRILTCRLLDIFSLFATWTIVHPRCPRFGASKTRITVPLNVHVKSSLTLQTIVQTNVVSNIVRTFRQVPTSGAPLTFVRTRGIGVFSFVADRAIFRAVGLVVVLAYVTGGT